MITGFLLGTATTLLGGLASHLLGKSIIRTNEFNHAAKDFISAFQEELTKLRMDCPSTPIYDIIYPARVKHGQAYAFFCRHLKGCVLKQFRQAWREYYLSTPVFSNKDQDKDEDIISICDQIEKLLEFAKYK